MPSHESAKALSDFLRKAMQAERVDVSLERALPSGDRRAHLLISAETIGGPLSGRHALVIRGEADDRGAGLASRNEFAIRKAVFGAGLTTPEPLWLEPEGGVLGRPFMVLRHVAGTVDTAALQRDLTVEQGDRIAYRLGQELSRLHQITLEKAPAEIAFLPHPGPDWARQRAERWRAALDSMAASQPCLEWAINWYMDNVPLVERLSLCHRDPRLGNVVVDGEQLAAILDLEQVGWSDPMEDLGWLCARGGRHGLPDREAGGIGSREALYDGYKDVAGHAVDDRRVRFWEIAAAIRQGIAALQRAAYPAGDAEQGLAAIFSGLQSLEAEYDLLLEIERYDAEAA